MMHGSECGARTLTSRPPNPCAHLQPQQRRCHARCCLLDLFIKSDGGYTTVAVALALLVSLTLVFGAAAAEWTQARSADVQVVADAAAMAGANTVAAYSTVAQVLDACVLSMGLAGLLVYAAGMVLAAIPFTQAASPTVLDLGRHIIDMRRKFARTATRGLSHLERALPALIMANSASCVSASCKDGIEYFGCAVPFPEESESDFSYLEDGLDHSELDENAERLREATQKREEALQRANEARERAWRADCIDAPSCMRSRAASLAGLSGDANPGYESAESWRFGYALVRAKNYYRLRLDHEAPMGAGAEELSRSASRKAFYHYAYNKLGEAICIEELTTIKLELPYLPHTRDEVRSTSLYSDSLWPCTNEQGKVTLHASTSCPGATGASAGSASIAMLDAGSVHECGLCHMNLASIGTVASASTNITNGFEHYWRILVDASHEYQVAHDEAEAAKKEMEDLAREGASAFQRAMELLSIPRPKLRPAGAWGCVSVVVRKTGTTVPSELTSAFLSSAKLPPGAAMSAATLAPDDATSDGNDILGRMLDGIGGNSFALDLVGNVTELWGKLLVGYGSAVENLGNISEGFLGGVGNFFGEKVAAWLRDRLTEIIKASGLEPVDMRLRKPVLVGSQKVLDKVGANALAKARELIAKLPSDVHELQNVNWAKVASELGYGKVTIAELPIPGTELTIPLTIDLERLAGAS